MKTLTVLIAFLSIYSCSKENTSNITKPNDALAQVKSVDVTDQRTVFSLLTPSEKTEFASEHLDYCIETMDLTVTHDFSEVPSYNPDKGTSCGCSSTSNYCSSSPYGPRIKCNPNACSIQSTWSYGTLWGYTCNGKCNLFSS